LKPSIKSIDRVEKVELSFRGFVGEDEKERMQSCKMSNILHGENAEISFYPIKSVKFFHTWSFSDMDLSTIFCNSCRRKGGTEHCPLMQ